MSTFSDHLAELQTQSEELGARIILAAQSATREGKGDALVRAYFRQMDVTQELRNVTAPRIEDDTHT